MSDSSQHKLDRNRTPRVHITYDVQRDGATVSRELPFVVGVLSDLSGHPEKPLKRLPDREFIEIDGETFDGVMADCAPRLQITVDNELEPGAKPLELVLHFNKLEDFSPDQVARQLKQLREMMDERDTLADVLNKMESTPRFGETLQEILRDQSKRERLSGEVDDLISRSTPAPEE
ncbi:MAG: type VI secretion system contractile sheath small subunit [Isosphaeraceae bacterium]